MPAAPPALEAGPVLKSAPPVPLVEGSEPSSPAGHRDHTDLFEWINFILLVVVLVYVLRKPVGHFFENRSSALRHELEEGRKALEAARAELAMAEKKLGNLEADIAALKAAAVHEGELEVARLKRSSEEEASRIMESARNMIDSATRSARLELKRAAADEAISLAEQVVRARLDDAGRSRLVSRFLEGIGKGKGPDKSA
ncbi:MAG: hypothetical protein KGM47_06725 [Acidobacteriota bacterium]|nr:hypothetical protein [Acidobacteriota bacterium]